MADKVVGPLTARQLAILAVTGPVLYAGWTATRGFVPPLVFLAVAIPVGVSAAIIALGQRDGISMDRYWSPRSGNVWDRVTASPPRRVSDPRRNG